MEQLLREALSARASQISAHDLRPAAPPNRRVRRLRPVYVAAVPLFGLAAALAFSVLGFKGDSVANRNDAPPAATLTATPSPTFTPSASPSAPTPSTSTSTSPSATTEPADDGEDDGSTVPPAAGTRSGTPTTATVGGKATPYTFRSLKFQVPAGWTVVPPAADSTTLCVLSPGAPSTGSSSSPPSASASAGVANWHPGLCAPYGVSLTSYNTPVEVEQAVWPTLADMDSDSAFIRNPECPAWANPHPMSDDERAGSHATTGVQSADIVAGRAIYKVQQQVTCNAKDSYTSQLWALPKDQVFVLANGLKADYQAGLVSILDTLDLSGRQAPVLKAHQNDIVVTFEGLSVGQQVSNSGTSVPFSVTWKNTSQTKYASVQPVVFAEGYAGNAADALGKTAGTLEFQDGDTWKTLDLGMLGGADDYLARRVNAAFPLAPGQSKTVNYRMKLTTKDGAGVLPITARSLLPYDGTGEMTVVGEKTIPVRVAAK
ncbi:hypothetical protein [Kitasatospora sp. NPDC050543]|uniref:hypothetical protein n=1 Tax=Kitasatospora sp. NPDC050543 TaxID=3364054 RepID=UPI0037981483